MLHTPRAPISFHYFSGFSMRGLLSWVSEVIQLDGGRAWFWTQVTPLPPCHCVFFQQLTVQMLLKCELNKWANVWSPLLFLQTFGRCRSQEKALKTKGRVRLCCKKRGCISETPYRCVWLEYCVRDVSPKSINTSSDFKISVYLHIVHLKVWKNLWEWIYIFL